MNPYTPFLQLARCHAWAMHRPLDAGSRPTDDEYKRNVGLFLKSIHGTLRHLLVGVNLLWYKRFSEGASALLGLDTGVEPDRDRMGQVLRGGAANWEHLTPPGRLSGLTACWTGRP